MSFSGSSSSPLSAPPPSPDPGASNAPAAGDDGLGSPGFDPQDPDLALEAGQDAGTSPLLPDSAIRIGAETDQQQSGPVDPFSGVLTSSPLDAYAGRSIDPYTNAAPQAVDPYTGGAAGDARGLFQLASYTNDAAAQSGDGNGVRPVSTIVGSEDAVDREGHWYAIYVYDNGTLVANPAEEDVSGRVKFADDPIVGSRGAAQNAAPTANPAPRDLPIDTSLPPLPPPDQPLPPLPPPDPPVQTLPETVIEGEVPFSPDVSDPKALERAQGAGRIEWGDVKQFGKGAYNGLVELLPIAMGPVLGPVVSKIDIPEAPIDERYGGAAIVGKQLGQNLALEGVAAVGVVGRVGSRGLKSGAEVVEYVGPNPVVSNQPWARYQVRATGSRYEQVFKFTRNGKVRTFSADAARNRFLVEAKQGYMGFWQNPLNWHSRMRDQATRYLKVVDTFGYRGVRYAVSDADKAGALQKLFKQWFPEAVKSGKLRVYWVP